jgi:DNA-binding MarR family transcriptional regulator
MKYSKLKGDKMVKDKAYVVYETIKAVNKTVSKDISCMMGIKFSKKINPSAIAILMHLMDGQPKALKELSHDVGLANSTTSGIIDKLVEEGYVSRVQDEDDRRRVLISATDKALNHKKDFEEKYEEYIRNILKNAKEEDYKIIIAGFSKFNELLKSAKRIKE